MLFASLHALSLYLHILAMAVWVGAGIQAPRDIETSLNPDSFDPTVLARLGRTARVMNVSALVTVISGAALFVQTRGLHMPRPAMGLAIGLTAVTYLVGLWVIRPAIGQLARVVRGEGLASGERERALGRFRLGVNVEHALRAVVLALMLFPNLL